MTKLKLCHLRRIYVHPTAQSKIRAHRTPILWMDEILHHRSETWCLIRFPCKYIPTNRFQPWFPFVVRNGFRNRPQSSSFRRIEVLEAIHVQLQALLAAVPFERKKGAWFAGRRFQSKWRLRAFFKRMGVFQNLFPSMNDCCKKSSKLGNKQDKQKPPVLWFVPLVVSECDSLRPSIGGFNPQRKCARLNGPTGRWKMRENQWDINALSESQTEGFLK